VSLALGRGVQWWDMVEKVVATPLNGRPSLFRIDSVHQMETSLSRASLVY
jgi:hypothetical protein